MIQIVIIIIFVLYKLFSIKSENGDTYDTNDISYDYSKKNDDNLLEKIVFYTEDKENIKLFEIDDDLYDVFEDDDAKINRLYDKTFSGDIIAYYDNNTPKIFVSKGINNNINSIKIFYKTGQIMFEYGLEGYTNILFTQYSCDGTILSSDKFLISKLDIRLDPITINEYLPYDIVTLYKILDTCVLSEIIENNNDISIDSGIQKYQKFVNLENTPISKKSVLKHVYSDIDDSKEEIMSPSIFQDKFVSSNNNSERVLSKDSDKDYVESFKNINISERNINTIGQTEEISDGPFRYYYDNGALKSTGTYKNGNLNILYVEYHPNGRKKVEGSYDNGKKIGIWKYFDDKGQLENEESFLNL
ncbi:toxin-antitoxin system YwqK family antitoxin [Fusobacterium sp. PH5-44]|uniref:toxin-antitoxin system YwqK family antitoxin n=1 Tax=unclassified Fusobacterium TaxID=2648384 RepID=UPI003D230562